MLVKEIMTKRIFCISETGTVEEAGQYMKNLGIGVLPVVREGIDNGKAKGIITDRDIVIRAVAEGLDPSQTSVKDIMTTDIQFCRDREDIKDVSQKMEDKQIRRMVVYDDDDRLIGIVSIGDISVNTDTDLAGRTLQKISEPPKERVER